MEWSDLVLILRDAGENLAMWIGLAACSLFAGAGAAIVSSPEHRARYQQLQDEVGDTHAEWELHRAQIPPRPLPLSTPPAQRPRVRAGSCVQAARDAKLRPSYDGRRVDQHQV